MMKMRKSNEYGQTAAAQEFSKDDVYKAFKDWKCWAFWFAQFGTDTMLYGYAASFISLGLQHLHYHL
jgi:hypothetical protein